MKVEEVVDAQAEVGFGVLESYRKGLGNHVMFHQLQRDWFDRACLDAPTEG